MMKNNKVKKGNTAKKLLPAAGMLALSASMLATSTYAWFTMSREVEVKNIQMTATAPVNVQMSLGDNMYTAMTSETAQLTAIGTGDGVGLVKAPANTDDSQDWSNTVAFYDFYKAPTLHPASSINGASIWKTADITGVGQTVAANGTASAAVPGALALVKTLANSDVNSNDSGYYVDFPVWFRTSSTTDATLTVKAVTQQGSNTAAKGHGQNDTAALYKAARVAILTSTDGTLAPANSAGVIIPYAKNGDTTAAQTTEKYYQDATALKAEGEFTSSGMTNRGGAAYGTVDPVIQTGESGAETVITIPGRGSQTTTYQGNSSNTSTMYGNATCVIVRVWLEGEDEDCWNKNEGQDFAIGLTFSDSTAST